MRVGRLHLITTADPGTEPLRAVRAALVAGTPVVQVRVGRRTSDRDAYQLASRILALCREYGATCLVNDRLHIALAIGADGGHVGATDLPVAAARRILGPTAILGATAREPVAARAAVADGATYVGVGPAYQTSTKDGLPAAIGPAGVALVAAAIPDTPVIAIGGVTAERVPALLAAGAYGVAVVGAINAARSPAAATRALLRALPPAALSSAAAGSAR
ncbi:MAG TPA: thiamine phosphate synthase [Micromonosporaceae bacterium]|nr:thiamine phosphate synthase [Micromonosporaceae bacterium]